ncbi:MAG: hypothetical protein DRZ90_17015 [Spirochaetes bacterium]|nr:MAG: hypothetical protein DRZ90_17015 [Spirochaetota bacterium]
MESNNDEHLCILFVCSARNWGGNEKWSAMSMNSLSDRGHDVILLARKKYLWSGRLKGVKVHSMPFFLQLNPFSYIASFFLIVRYRVNRIISTKRAEYVVMGLLSRILGIRHLIRLGIVRNIDNRYKEWLYGKLNDGIIVNASKTRTVLLESQAIESSAVTLIYNGIPDPPEAAEIENKELFRIVSIGSLHPRKGFDRLIKGISLLPQRDRERVELVLVGEGPALLELKKLTRDTGLEHQVLFRGFLENPGKELEQSQLFALITGNEGISNALLEAMVLGIPVLTTTAGGTEDFLVDGENGFLVDDSPEAVSRRLQEILISEDLKAIGLRGRTTVLDFFSIERMTDDLEKFIIGNPS